MVTISLNVISTFNCHIVTSPLPLVSVERSKCHSHLRISDSSNWRQCKSARLCQSLSRCAQDWNRLRYWYVPRSVVASTISMLKIKQKKFYCRKIATFSRNDSKSWSKMLVYSPPNRFMRILPHPTLLYTRAVDRSDDCSEEYNSINWHGVLWNSTRNDGRPQSRFTLSRTPFCNLF